MKVKTLGFILVMLGSLSYGGNEAEAFDAGINSALKVFKYERQNVNRPLSGRFCLSLRTKQNKEVTSFVAVKLESLGLLLGVKPSFYQLPNPDGKNGRLFCLLRTDTEKDALEQLAKIRDDGMQMIDEYYPHVVRIRNDGAMKRIIPVIGELFKNEQQTVVALSEQIARLKKESAKKDLIVARVKEAFKLLVNNSKDLFEGKSGVYGASSTAVQSKKETVVIPPKKEIPNDIIIQKGKDAVRYVSPTGKKVYSSAKDKDVLFVKSGER